MVSTSPDSSPDSDPVSQPDFTGATDPANKQSLLVVALTALAALLAIVALIAACWFGFGWGKSLITEKPRADAREAALDGARQAAVNLNSMNPDNVQGAVDLMKSSSTGAMLDQIDSNQDKLVQVATQSKARLESNVLGSSVTELNTDDDTAKVLVVLTQKTTFPDNKTPTTQRVSWTLDMKKVDDTWKAEQATSIGAPTIEDGGAPQAGQEPAPAPAQPDGEAPAPAQDEGGQ